MTMRARMVAVLAACLSITMSASVAGADVSAVTPMATVIAPPASVVEGALESDTEIRVFTEREDFALPSALAADIDGPGIYDETADLTTASIPAGTVVDSHFVHADPVGTSATVTMFSGTVTFDADILGVMVQNASLDASDGSLGALGTTYPTGDATRKLELNVTGKNADVLVADDLRTVQVTLRNSTGLDQIRVVTVSPNRNPDCSGAQPNKALLWPPNHKFIPVSIQGVTDADGDPTAVTITSIRQDEPVNTISDGNTAPDGQGIGTGTAAVRAERAGSKKVPGDGRVYHIGFEATDGNGGSCTGTVKVGVPHDKKPNRPLIDGGPLYDSTMS